MKVLVVDDDPDQLMLRCLLLQRNGFTTVQAGDPTSALSVAHSENPDCTVLDVRLPDEDSGLRLIRELKQALPGMIIILFTGLRAGRLNGKQELTLVHQVIEKSAGPARLIRVLKDVRPSCGSAVL
jgi:two-component system, response regulator RegA